MPRGKSSQSNPVLRLLPRGIFDKETRRKAVAVAGAAMELKARTGFDREGNNPGVIGRRGEPGS